MSAATASAAVPAPVERSRVRVIFAGLMLVLLLAALDQTIVATALPTIVGDLGGLDRLAWVTSAFLLAQTAVTPVYGKLGDLYGRKRVLQSAVILFLIGSALCGQANGMTELIAFRAVQGLGAGGLIVLTQAVIGDVVSPRERGRYQGLFGAVFGVASVAGPLLGGVIVEAVSWRWFFYVNLPVGIVSLAVLAAALPTVQGRERPVIDYLGAGLLAGGLGAIVLVTSLGGTTWAWGSAQVVLLAALGVLLLVFFLAAERRAREPVLPPALLRDPVFAVAGGAVADRRLRLVRVGHLPAALFPDGGRRDSHRGGPSAGPDDGRCARDVDRLGAAHLPHWPLPRVSDRRDGGDGDRAVPAVPP